MHLRYQSYDFPIFRTPFYDFAHCLHDYAIAMSVIEDSNEPEQLHAQNLAWIEISIDALNVLRCGAPLLDAFPCLATSS